MSRNPGKPPIINAPLPVTVFAVVLLAAHGVRVLLPSGLQNYAYFHGALIPERFWADAGGAAAGALPAYGSVLTAAASTVTSAFLHGDWMHVVLNSALLVAMAKPLLELFRRVWPGREPAATGMLLALFLAAQVTASLTYLAMNYPDGPIAVGASGGISGLLAALLLLRGGPDQWLLTRGFLVASALFVVANALLAVLGPSLLGAGIAWQAHIGGYLGGALFMRLVLWRMAAGAA
ncbi:rhomboid family intramembrane serine protease [Hyphomonas sp.]|uniref:rhomboid family intramembrane serine protease n=1 Tax=Hyphomonas sp. TaxID=87 RepID=UPI00391C0040